MVQNIHNIDAIPRWGSATSEVDFSKPIDFGDSKQLGENGCAEFTDHGIGSNLLAISQLVRGGDPTRLADEILNSGSARDISDLVVLLFVTRNSRGGKGEKQLAHRLFFSLRVHYPLTAQALLPLFKEYGYWKDLLLLSEMAFEREADAEDLLTSVCELMKGQLVADMHAVEEYKQQLSQADQVAAKKIARRGPRISLLAKWLPRENSHFDRSVKFVDKFARLMWGEPAKARYRKTVSELTKFFELPEVLLATQRADEINFSKLASKATLLLTKSFLNEDGNGKARSDDPKRVRLAQLFVEHLTKPHSVKAAQVDPHEIVARIMSGRKLSANEELVLDAQWKELWAVVVSEVKAKAAEEGVEFSPARMVPLSDVSGSMSGVPMEVAIALGIGISEITHPAFQHMVMTFESTPRWHRLNPADTIAAKVRSLQRAPWGGSTDFAAAYDLILHACVEHKLRREDMPSLIVFSDMQFDQASGARSSRTMHQTIRTKVARVARQLSWEDSEPMPMVYWNLRNTGGHPVDKETEGAVLLSGYSPSLLKLVMNGEALKEEEVEVASVAADGAVRIVTEKVRVTPQEVMRRMLRDTQYDAVRQVLSQSNEGVFAGDVFAACKPCDSDDEDAEMAN